MSFTLNRNQTIALLLGVLALLAISSWAYILLSIGRVSPGGSDYKFRIIDDYFLIRTSSHHVSVSPLSYSSNTPRIPEKVIQLGWDNRFILAKQEKLSSESSESGASYGPRVPTGVYSYWVLDTKLKVVDGPLTPDEFKSITKTTGLESIKLSNPETFR